MEITVGSKWIAKSSNQRNIVHVVYMRSTELCYEYPDMAEGLYVISHDGFRRHFEPYSDPQAEVLVSHAKLVEENDKLKELVATKQAFIEKMQAECVARDGAIAESNRTIDRLRKDVCSAQEEKEQWKTICRMRGNLIRDVKDRLAAYEMEEE